jgi:hypothetical protein
MLKLGTYRQEATFHHPAQGLQNQNGGGKYYVAKSYELHFFTSVSQ